jgi:hypothetical protein
MLFFGPTVIPHPARAAIDVGQLHISTEGDKLAHCCFNLFRDFELCDLQSSSQQGNQRKKQKRPHGFSLNEFLVNDNFWSADQPILIPEMEPAQSFRQSLPHQAVTGLPA